jgi:hypothetical protein
MTQTLTGFGAPGRIRTDDARLRTAALYSTELRGLGAMLPRRGLGAGGYSHAS